MEDIKKTYAVLTGDLVKSSKLTSDNSKFAMELLKKMANEFAKIYPSAVEGRMDTFRHDSWQLLLREPQLAIRAAIYFRAALKMQADAKTKYDTRISIGIGGVEFVSKRRISDSRGAAFTYSGEGLDKIKGRRSIDKIKGQHLIFISGGGSATEWQWIARGIIPLLDCIAGDWTPRESRAIYGALKEWTQEESAENWPPNEKTGKRPTRQAVGESLDRAHWDAVNEAISWVEKGIKQALGLA